jgi:tetratricopeptide (TPR) repeat protein
MNIFRLIAQFSGHLWTRIRTSVPVIVAVLALFPIQERPVHAQPSSPDNSSALQGSVRDLRGRPVAAAIVHLQAKLGAQALTTQTDFAGTYRFSSLRPGEYVVRAELAGFAEATSGSFVLGGNETKNVDLTLGSPKADLSDSAAPQAEFFDEPRFTVAGVTDSTNLGGHGSNTIARTKDALAKDTISLSSDLHPVPFPVTSHGTSEKALRDAVARQSSSFEANQELGKLLVAEGKATEAIQYLERASQLNSASYENAYLLGLAFAYSGDYRRARVNIRQLLAAQGKDVQHSAELHHLLAEVEGKLRNPVEAVREYQLAAELNPSERNLFDWASELLKHRANQPAIEVFSKGNRLFPGSIPMKLGLGAAWYANGSYEQAVQHFCDASDLNPADPTPYLFIGRLQNAENIPSQRLVEKLKRFVRLQPENAMANYYYARILWKRSKSSEQNGNSAQLEALLRKAVRLDPNLGVAYLQLGILYGERTDFPNAISAYQKAIQTSPQMAESHYRLSQIYKRTGESLKAQQEMEIFDQISRKEAEEAERERRDIQQFVYKLRDQMPGAQPQ